MNQNLPIQANGPKMALSRNVLFVVIGVLVIGVATMSVMIYQSLNSSSSTPTTVSKTASSNYDPASSNYTNGTSITNDIDSVSASIDRVDVALSQNDTDAQSF